MTSERRQLRFDDWDAVLSDVERLLSGGYEHARKGNWSLGQICSHLAVVLECAVDGFPSSLPWPVQKILRFMVLPSNLRHTQLNGRFPAPKFAVPPEEVADEDGVTRLKAAIERFRQPDTNYVNHVAYGKLTREEWHHQQFWHCEHHLSYLLPRQSETE